MTIFACTYNFYSIIIVKKQIVSKTLVYTILFLLFHKIELGIDTFNLFMPTSSQSQILSVVDYQLLHQQQQQQQPTIAQDGVTVKPAIRISVNQTPLLEARRRLSKDERRPSIGKKFDNEKLSPSSQNLLVRRRSSLKLADGKTYKN